MPKHSSIPVDANRDLIALLIAIKHIAVEQFRMHRTGAGIPFLAFQTLHYIDTKGQATMKDIAHLFCITPPAATSLIKTLLKRKLVAQKIDPRDRRKTVLTVAPAGTRLLVEERAHMTENITKIFSVLSSQDRTTLIKIFQTIVAAHATK